MASRPFDFEAFIQSAGDAIVAAGTNGSILLWNRAAERIFGYTEAEALGHSLDLIIPQRLRIRHWEGYRRVMQTGETRYGTEVLRVPAVHKDGRPSPSPLLSHCCMRRLRRSRRSRRSFVTKLTVGKKNARCVNESPSWRQRNKSNGKN